MLKTTRYRSMNIHSQLNKLKCKSHKVLKDALISDSAIGSHRIQAAHAILQLLSIYEGGLEL
jgi:hypothetical protein